MDESGQAPTTADDSFLTLILQYPHNSLFDSTSTLYSLLGHITPSISENELSTSVDEEPSPLPQALLTPRTPITPEQPTLTNTYQDISIFSPTHPRNIPGDTSPFCESATTHLPLRVDKTARSEFAENPNLNSTIYDPNLIFDARDQTIIFNTLELINDATHMPYFTRETDISLLNLDIAVMESNVPYLEAAQMLAHSVPSNSEKPPQHTCTSASSSSSPVVNMLKSSSNPERQSPDPERNTLPTSPSLVQRTGKRIRRRSKVDHDLLDKAFTPSSGQPDEHLRSCLDRVLDASFYRNDELEPKLDSEDGITILGFPTDSRLSSNFIMSKSVYHLFIDAKKKACLICNQSKGTVLRATGCVRGHLGHRPFRCTGEAAGCASCVKGEEPAKFFTAALLDDHIKGQMKKYRCKHPNCDSQLRRGGMKRHWQSKHKNDPYPRD